ncbi:MAG: hypothetical protein HN368_23885 [Spirochaetales bacterium]|jgi:hypothetical protein|nr:hypothetical protein [Spirochaetales bacterium]
MAEKTPNLRLLGLMKRELELLETFRGAELELKNSINEKDWDSLDTSVNKMNLLSIELVDIEESRNTAFHELRELIGENKDAGFYQVIVHLPPEERELLAELYRAMKFTAVGIQAVTYCIDEHVQTINGTMHQILNELFPYRKGNMYSKEGKRREIEQNPMVVNHHL